MNFFSSRWVEGEWKDKPTYAHSVCAYYFAGYLNIPVNALFQAFVLSFTLVGNRFLGGEMKHLIGG